MIRVKVFAILRLSRVFGRRELDVQWPREPSLLDLASELFTLSNPLAADALFLEDGEGLRPDIQVFINGHQLSAHQRPRVRLANNDEVMLLPADPNL